MSSTNSAKLGDEKTTDALEETLVDSKYGPEEMESVVGICYDEYCLNHMKNVRHCEIPLRILSIYNYFTQKSPHKNKWKKIEARLATKEECEWVHDPRHVKKVWELASFDTEKIGKRLTIAPDCTVTWGTYKSILLSCGGLLAGTAKVLENTLNSCCCILRPPGHHAECSKFMGFCYINNVGVAAELAKRKFGLQKIAIVDWDVHWGNATQRMFYDDPTVFYISTHRYDDGFFYPCDEEASEEHIGKGKGEGYNMNLPLYKGMGDKQYMAIWDHLVIPILGQYKPELIIISAGFDSAKGDPLGGMKVTPPGYAYFTEQLKKIQPKIVVCLEGGYNCDYIPLCYHATAQALLNSEPLHPFRADYLKGSPSMRNEFNYHDGQAIHRMKNLRKLMSKCWEGFASEMGDKDWEESLREAWGEKRKKKRKPKFEAKST